MKRSFALAIAATAMAAAPIAAQDRMSAPMEEESELGGAAGLSPFFILGAVIGALAVLEISGAINIIGGDDDDDVDLPEPPPVSP